MPTKLTLFDFWRDKEKEWGRNIPVLEVSKATGIHRATLAAYLDDKVKRPDLELLGKLCEYFNIPDGPIPFLIYKED